VASDSGPAASGPPIIQFEDRPGILDLSWGHPEPSLLPVEQWLRAGEASAAAFGWRALAYGYATGPGPLLDWLTGHLSRIEGGRTTPEQTFVTAGASHALSLVATVLAEPGDVVLVDSPTYHLAFRILADRGVRLVRAPADQDGIEPAALADLVGTLRAAGDRAPLLYLVPTFANPTGRSLPGDRRRALVELAHRAGLTIVEDDTYRELAYDGPAPDSLWRLAAGTGVVRLGSFAKTVAPGLRLGWINAEPPVVRRLARLGYVDSGGGVNHTTALTMAAFGAGGGYDRHVAAVRRRYRMQRDALVTALRERAPALRTPSPAGGWFLWVPLPAGLPADRLLAAAERHGTSFVPGHRFFADGRGGADRIRLSFSLLPPADLARAAQRLAAALDSA
jgi:2-aminoadipate transaminase